MNKKDKDEFTNLISDALNDVVVPAFDAMETRLKEELASKEDLRKVEKRLSGVESTLDSLDRKFDAQQDRLDKYSFAMI